MISAWWCPNGCGKCVISLYLPVKIKERYKCIRCKTIFTHRQLKKIN